MDVGVEHVDTSNVQISAFATEKSTTVRSRGLRRFGDGSENAVRPMVGRGSAEQLKSVGRSNTQSRSQARRPPHPGKNNFVSGIVSMVFTAELDLRAEEPLEN
jgi:hypothetical protein